MVKHICEIIMPFGKIKGKPLGRVFDDTLYMEWMNSHPSPGKAMKYILRLYQEYLKEEYKYKLESSIIEGYKCSVCEFLSVDSSFCEICNFGL